MQQLKVYEHQTLNAGLRNTHGLRHAWAQERYHQLTGWTAPAAGGPTAASWGREQRLIAGRGCSCRRSWATTALRSRRCTSDEADAGRGTAQVRADARERMAREVFDINTVSELMARRPGWERMRARRPRCAL